MRRGSAGRGREPASLADDAAVGPFEASVAERDVGLAEHHDAALEAALAGKALQHRVDLLDEGVVHANGEMRYAAQVLQRRSRGVRNRPERVRVERLAGDLLREGEGEGDRLLLDPGMARLGIREERAGRAGEPLGRLSEPRR